MTEESHIQVYDCRLCGERYTVGMDHVCPNAPPPTDYLPAVLDFLDAMEP